MDLGLTMVYSMHLGPKIKVSIRTARGTNKRKAIIKMFDP